MTIKTYRGYSISTRHFSHEELVKIDEDLPATGASQEAGIYYSEVQDGEEDGAPCGPYVSEDEAFDSYKEHVDRYLDRTRRK